MAGTTTVSVSASAYTTLATSGPCYVSPQDKIAVVASSTTPDPATVGHPLINLGGLPWYFSLSEKLWGISLSTTGNNVAVVVTT
jgi:hypothetical protein